MSPAAIISSGRQVVLGVGGVGGYGGLAPGTLASPHALTPALHSASAGGSPRYGPGGRGYETSTAQSRLHLYVAKIRESMYETITLQRVFDELEEIVRRDDSGCGRTAAAAGDVGAVEAVGAAMRTNIRDAVIQESGGRLLHALVQANEANRERARCVAAHSALSEAAAVHRAQTRLRAVVRAVLLLLE